MECSLRRLLVKSFAKSSKNPKEPCKDLFLAGAEMDLEFLKYVQEKVAEILKSK
jgi:hypothetical protein